MMTTMNNRNAVEAYFIHTIRTISKAGIRSMSTLRAVPALHDAYITALHTWLTRVAFATSSCASIIRSNNLAAEDVTSDLLARMLRTERRICHKKGRTEEECLEASLHPAIDYVLRLAVDRDPTTVIKYLMRMANNFCIEKFRKAREMKEKTVQTDPETLRHADAQATDAGAVRKHPTLADRNCEMQRRERYIATFSCFDQDFLHDAALLSDAIGMPRKTLADIIISGRNYELACSLVESINSLLGGDYTDAFEPFLRTARTFRLPAKLQGDMKALMRCLYTATNSDSRQKMKTRIIAAIA